MALALTLLALLTSPIELNGVSSLLIISVAVSINKSSYVYKYTAVYISEQRNNWTATNDGQLTKCFSKQCKAVR